MFAGIGGFREGLTRAGDFVCVGHCEIDKHADRSYRALFDMEGEWFLDDIRKADPADLPDFDLLCGGFPCQSFSIAGSRGGFDDPRGTLFFELARLAEARHPKYWLAENVPGLLDHDGGRTFAAILREMEKLGYFVEWQVLNSADFGVPQARKRVYLIGYLDERCRGKIFPFTEGAGAPAVQPRPAEAAAQIKCATKKGYQTARVGDSIDLSYATSNTRRGRVGHGIAHTLTACGKQGTLCFVDLNADPKLTENARCLTTRQDNGIHRHKGEVSGVLQGGRIRRLTPRECLRLQGWADDRIDKIEQLQAKQIALENKIAELQTERQRLYRTAPNSPEIPAITAALKPLRRDLKLCKEIAAHSAEMRQRLADAERERQQEPQTKPQQNQTKTNQKAR